MNKKIGFKIQYVFGVIPFVLGHNRDHTSEIAYYFTALFLGQYWNFFTKSYCLVSQKANSNIAILSGSCEDIYVAVV